MDNIPDVINLKYRYIMSTFKFRIESYIQTHTVQRKKKCPENVTTEQQNVGDHSNKSLQ